MKTIGRYEIRATLGKGAMGTVYKVLVPGLEKIAALKCLTPGPKLIEKTGLKPLRDQFIREAAIVANIRHPNITEMWSLEEAEGRLFFLMEFFCHNLGALIGENYWADTPTRIIPAEKACGFLSEILRGLSRLHYADIIHRDLKPFNIMLTDQGTVKIADFGLSRKRGEAILLEEKTVVVGTPFYTAPEQITRPDAVDHRADLYAAGVLFYRMLTGALPQSAPTPPSQLNPDLDDTWDEFLFTALAENPSRRHPSARAMREQLAKLFEGYLEKKSRVCTLPEATVAETSPEGATVPPEAPLRSESRRIPAKRAKDEFHLDDLYRPESYTGNAFAAQSRHLIEDAATGLIWQKGGSPYPVPFDQAHDYIEQLNATGFGGFRNWRLPTMNELLTLLAPSPPDRDFCFESPFDDRQKWVWSGDTRSPRAAWVLNVEMGFVTSTDVLDFYYVKAVCTAANSV